ncbi:MAG: response regulator [Sphingomonas bacterium]|nr:response regulator [Sphingomonas bacterium]
MLNKALVLIAEDESFIALDLALAIEDAGGTVVGPAATVEEALALIDARTVAAAILDVNLGARDISPVAEILLNLKIPVILQTGVEVPPALAARFPDLIVHIKPCVAATLVAQLETLIASGPSAVPPDDGGAA